MAEKSTTKVWGALTSELLKVFQKYVDCDGHLHFTKLRAACNDLSLYPSTSQVHEMLMCAVEYGSPCKPDHITFGEFCVLVSELQNYYNMNPKPPVPHSLVKVRSEVSISKRKRRESLAHFEVFLGGSCNPTKWRAELAIPYFKEHGITFYNPQVQQWKPELMELEAQAKQMADVLFFVIDSKTRAISSMIEVAYLIATQRQVVVMMCDYKDNNIEVNGHQLTDSEMSDLVRGRLILTDLIERNSVPIFSDIHKALNCTRLILTQRKYLKDLTIEDGALPVKHGHLKLGSALLELREAFNSVDSSNSGYLTSKDVSLAYKSCTGGDLDTKWLKQRRKDVTEDKFVYEEFCSIVTEYREQSQSEDSSLLQRVLNQILQPFRWIAAKMSSSNNQVDLEDEEYRHQIRDVYLGGSCGCTKWRSGIVEPALRKHGLSYVDPDVHNWDQKLIPIHVALRETCRLLLYVITDDRRSLSSMCEAGYYIGKGCRMVLCVRKLTQSTVINEEQITECAVKDYNRGREYLSDLANREGIPLFDDVSEAVTCVISILTGDSGTNTS